MQLINKRIKFTKGQLISKCLFGVFNSSKKRTKNFWRSRLGQKLKFLGSLFFDENLQSGMYLKNDSKELQMLCQIKVGEIKTDLNRHS